MKPAFAVSTHFRPAPASITFNQQWFPSLHWIRGICKWNLKSLKTNFLNDLQFLIKSSVCNYIRPPPSRFTLKPCSLSLCVLVLFLWSGIVSVCLCVCVSELHILWGVGEKNKMVQNDVIGQYSGCPPCFPVICWKIILPSIWKNAWKWNECLSSHLIKKEYWSGF